MIKTITLLSIVLLITSCSSNKFTVVQPKKDGEIFINPPIPIFKRFGIKKNGDWAGKSKVFIGIKNIPTNVVNSTKIKVNYSRNVKIVKGDEFPEDSDVNIYGYFNLDQTLDIYSSWNYRSFYDETTRTFNYEKFIHAIDELRLSLDKLEIGSYTYKKYGDTLIKNDTIRFIVNNINHLQTASMKRGIAQEIINTFFDYLVLPNSCSLYNYGYLDEKILNSLNRKRYLYFLDENMGLNTFYNDLSAHIDTVDCRKEVFTNNLSAHFSIEKNALNSLQISSFINKTNGTTCSPYLSTPLDFEKKIANHSYNLILHGAINLRSFDATQEFYQKDLNLISIDTLQDIKNLISNFKLDITHISIKKNLKKLKRQNKLYYIEGKDSDGDSYYKRFYYQPSIRTFIIRKINNYVEYIPLGSRTKLKSIKRVHKKKDLKLENIHNLPIYIKPLDIIKHED